MLRTFRSLPGMGRERGRLPRSPKAQGMTGTALRRVEYLQRDYAGMGFNQEIGQIAERARKRLDAAQVRSRRGGSGMSDMPTAEELSARIAARARATRRPWRLALAAAGVELGSE